MCDEHRTKQYATYQDYIDSDAYTKKVILGYEKCFGLGFVSHGGAESTEELCKLLNLKPGTKVLDVGSGLGGGAIHMAKQYGAEVLGLDVSGNMVTLAEERLSKSGATNVSFVQGDVRTINLSESSFDVVYSREVIMHFEDKLPIYQRIHTWLKPGGTLMVTDFCSETEIRSEIYKIFVNRMGYFVYPMQKYGEIISSAGFKDVQVIDRSKHYERYVRAELDRLKSFRSQFTMDNGDGLDDQFYNELCDMWSETLLYIASRDESLGLFIAKKDPN